MVKVHSSLFSVKPLAITLVCLWASRAYGQEHVSAGPSAAIDAWDYFRLDDVPPVLVPMAVHLRGAMRPSVRETGLWGKGVPHPNAQTPKVTLEIETEELESGGEIVVGFFDDPTWHRPPLHVRSFREPGAHTLDGIPLGAYQIGAMKGDPIGTHLEEYALGVHRSWPRPVVVDKDGTAKAEILISSRIKLLGSGPHPFHIKAMFGDWKKVDPTRLVTVQMLDDQGKPSPFCSVWFTDEGKYRNFHLSGTDTRGLAYCDGFDGPLSISARKDDFFPEKLLHIYRVAPFGKIYNALDRPTITYQWPPIPKGPGKVVGRVRDQEGRPLNGFFVSLMKKEAAVDATNWLPEVVWSLPTADPEGRFEVDSLPAGRYEGALRAFDYQAYVWDFSMFRFEIPEKAEEPIRLEWEVEAKELLYGIARYPDGSPVARGTWSLSEDDTTGYGFEPGGKFRVNLSRTEKGRVQDTLGGKIVISDINSNSVKVPIERLSRDLKAPAEVILPREEPKEKSQKPPVEVEDHYPPVEIPPDLELLDVEGKYHRISAYRGRPVLLYFAMIKCGPCRMEEKRLKEHIAASWLENGLTILMVWPKDEPGDVENFARREAFPFPVLLDAKGQLSHFIPTRDGQMYFPTNVLLDRDFGLRYLKAGFNDELFAILGSRIDELTKPPEKR